MLNALIFLTCQRDVCQNQSDSRRRRNLPSQQQPLQAIHLSSAPLLMVQHHCRPDFKTHTTQEEIADLGLSKENPQRSL